MKNLLAILMLLPLASLSCGSSLNKSVENSRITRDTLIPSPWKLVQVIPGNFQYHNVDVLGNIYVITAGNQLKKMNSFGDSLAVFNDVKRFGNPSYIDVSNPLKILVYYQNFSTIVVLDRLLVNRNILNLRKLNTFNIKAVGTSYDNNMWIFDEQEFKLRKIDNEGKLLLESADIRQLVDSVPANVRLIDHENRVLLYDERLGFYIFDYYGALKGNIQLKNLRNIAAGNNIVYGFSNGSLITYDLGTMIERKFPLPPEITATMPVIAINRKVYALAPEGIRVYSPE